MNFSNYSVEHFEYFKLFQYITSKCEWAGIAEVSRAPIEMIWKCHYFTKYIGMCVSGIFSFSILNDSIFFFLLSCSYSICCLDFGTFIFGIRSVSLAHSCATVRAHHLTWLAKIIFVCVFHKPILMCFEWVLRESCRLIQKPAFISPEKKMS